MTNMAALAASATVFDTIEDVARDTGVMPHVARVYLVQFGIASVDDDGRVTMSERQSACAASVIAGIGGGW